MEEPHRISFSSNGAGVILHTKYGELKFSTEEFTFYQNLFRVADHTSQGSLALGSSQLVSVISRCDMPWNTLEKAIHVISGVSATNGHAQSSGDAEKFLRFHQWLMLCKYIAYLQETNRAPKANVFKDLHVTSIRIPLARFHIHSCKRDFSGLRWTKEYQVTITGWQIYGDEYQNQHAKFQLNVLTSWSYSLDNGQVVCSGTERITVERRYSEFESFVQVMTKYHRGYIIPPLPIKNWTFMPPGEAVISQRAQEFQMFLDDITSHPSLRYSFALKAFLESSTVGWKAYLDINSRHVVAVNAAASNGHVDNLSRPASKTAEPESLVKIISEGAVAVASNPQLIAVGTKAVGFFNSLWSSVTKTVPVFTSRATSHRQGEEALARAAQRLECIAELGKKLDHVLIAQTGYHTELAKMALPLKAMSDLESVPELTRGLQVLFHHISVISKIQQDASDHQRSNALIPINYLGRYTDSFQQVCAQRMEAHNNMILAQNREQDAKRIVEELKATLHVSQGLTPAPAKTSSVAAAVPPAIKQSTSGTGKGKKGAINGISSSSNTGSAVNTPHAGVVSSTRSVGQLQPHDDKQQQQLNMAEKELAAAEDLFEHYREEKEEIGNQLRNECQRLQVTHDSVILKSLIHFVNERLKLTQASLEQWEALKQSFE